MLLILMVSVLITALQDMEMSMESVLNVLPVKLLQPITHVSNVLKLTQDVKNVKLSIQVEFFLKDASNAHQVTRLIKMESLVFHSNVQLIDHSWLEQINV